MKTSIEHLSACHNISKAEDHLSPSLGATSSSSDSNAAAIAGGIIGGVMGTSLLVFVLSLIIYIVW